MENKKAQNQSGALRYDTDKPDLSLIPSEFFVGLARVFMYGTQKYAKDNWRMGMKWSRMYNSAMRHVLAFWASQNTDEESGLHHLLHAAWNILCLWWYTQHNIGTDDRYKKMFQFQQHAQLLESRQQLLFQIEDEEYANGKKL